MDEATANTKWCPYAGEARIDRQTEKCIASYCMAWRWVEAKRSAAFFDAVKDRMVATGENMKTASETVWKNREPEFVHSEGFCGLAGAHS